MRSRLIEKRSAKATYEAFEQMGLEYGSSHRGLVDVFAESGEVLAKVVLPKHLVRSAEDYTLHPSLLDSALQAASALSSQLQDKPALPFALEKLEVRSACPQTLWAWLREAEGSTEQVRKLDIDLCDEIGNVCVAMRGFSARVLKEGLSLSVSEPTDTLLFKPTWKVKAITETVKPANISKHLVFLCGFAVLQEKLAKQITNAEIDVLTASNDLSAPEFTNASLKLFKRLQQLIELKPRSPVLVQVLVPDEGGGQLYHALSGLLKTARQENPHLNGQVIELAVDSPAQAVVKCLQANAVCPEDIQVRYEGSVRKVQGFEEMGTKGIDRAESVWKSNGVYLITGGLGGLGLIVARSIAASAQALRATNTDDFGQDLQDEQDSFGETLSKQTGTKKPGLQGTVLILTGRSKLSAEKGELLASIRALGAVVEYHRVDVTDRSQVDVLLSQVLSTHGKLTGIVHSAGVIEDDFIVKKRADSFERVLSPKVAGVVNLDEASRDLALDVFVLFSSVAGALGNVGQCDYATGNAFLDVYASYRNGLMSQGERSGQTVSINWPLWAEGGMRVDPETEQVMARTAGMTALSADSGLRALEQALLSGLSEVLVLSGQRERLLKFVTGTMLDRAPTTEHRPSELGLEPVTEELSGNGAFDERVLRYLKQQLAGVLKLPVQRIDADEPLEKYGIDSIMVMQLTQKLEQSLGSLPKTLFFEHSNLRSLGMYLSESYRLQFAQFLDQGAIEQRSVPRTSARLATTGVSVSSKKRRRFSGSLGVVSGQTVVTGDIAIIGLSGRYPQSENLEVFWANLRDGKDCVTEIPAERWDWREYYSEDRHEAGRHYSKWGGFIADVDQFDPLFFNISPREAELIDPQERLFLEHVWHALEDSGYTRSDLHRAHSDDLPGQVGVYAGVMYSEYQLHSAGSGVAAGSSYASIANRVSYVLNLHGPSMGRGHHVFKLPDIVTPGLSGFTSGAYGFWHSWRGEC